MGRKSSIDRLDPEIKSYIQAMLASGSMTLDELIAAALPFVDSLIAEGVSVIEVKSGYGLDMETELRMLRVARALGQRRPVIVRTTFLGAHAIPPEFRGRPTPISTVSASPR